ncbi:MAG: large conductance mechanosensitive channel protein MscL [Candidatus Yonathbacteria bacterium CG_4_10_14_3_um_filter_47_65]|uniref:Large-conductance mechanosensitive channel n=1 Tax=Candidatus Yonathbacteria bacterium CG_4_9_14_0_8_um_filter_46_47 TaxID=1975106 RepID=A0A2M8D9Y5_9BACT|nr:MAG: large conductance mechanosensitive channel protein MscL [Candidatus Yonathbacteria bacterium CG23_combo_of_CG06-09_8_20_14_all_46_18]PIQ33048.1 MAG: large conductance mechanosensitive channel protein MscL [Candidatus Yonathbacteria bacterium CG17_big_fil_post_rev_8_21_14_2_50_46_19]PIX56078.1 MAG: large conductance mechanosensitive channel protein MscL [Candidatus Yonathbacteria bacterium CG_4_10_14_3_um_filter_47_65]PJB83957.1 MAG: large conductance mechanosensitive channel protein MscL
MKKVINEFKKFAMRGNVVDLAVGVVIGTAFGKITNSLVNDIIMPPIGAITGGVDFSKLFLIVKDTVGDSPAVVINYGSFINTVLDFLIIAFAIFMVVKIVNNLKREEAEKPSDPTEKNCVYCLSKIPIQATRCAYCTSDIKK